MDEGAKTLEFTLAGMKSMETGKPVIAVGFNPDATHWIYKKTGLVSYGSPEKAAFTISQLSKYGAYQKRARERVEEITRPVSVPERVPQMLQGKSGALDEQGLVIIRKHKNTKRGCLFR
jgi:acyl-CoA synthetase (NDP forming)